MMKRYLRCIVSMMLALVLAFGTLPTNSRVEAATAGKTADDAIAWVRSKLGQELDYDGVYGAQCVDLIAYYYQFLGQRAPGGNAVAYSWNALPAGWQRLKNAQLQKGDILVYGWSASNPLGHVAIYEADRVTYHQNIDGKQYVRQVSYRYNGLGNPYWGVIRPDWAVYTPPAPSPVDQVKALPKVELGDSFNALIYNPMSNKMITRDEANDNVMIYHEVDFGRPSKNQVWHFKRLATGNYKITNRGNEECLDLFGASVTSGVNIHTFPWNDSSAQHYELRGNRDGFYMIPACAPNNAVGVAGAFKDDGTNIQSCSIHTYPNPAQVFKVIYLPTDLTLDTPQIIQRNDSHQVTFSWRQTSNTAWHVKHYEVEIYKGTTLVSRLNSGQQMYASTTLPGGQYGAVLRTYSDDTGRSVETGIILILPVI